MKRLDSAAWRRIKATAKTMLAHLRIDTPRNAFATIASAAIGLLIALLFPGEGLAKIIAGAIGWIVIQTVLLFWIYRTLPEEPKPVFGYSPLYTSAGRQQFRAEQLAIQQQIAQLSSQRARLEVEMAKLDLTTGQGQEQFSNLARQRAEVGQKLAVLNSSVRNIGFTGD